MSKLEEKGLKHFRVKFPKTNKCFWKFIKPFVTNKPKIAGHDTTLTNGKTLIRMRVNECEKAKTFNENFILLLKNAIARNQQKRVIVSSRKSKR